MASIKPTQSLGNLPALRVTFYKEQDTKPEIKPGDGFRVAFLGFKTLTDKTTKEKSLRCNMAVQVHSLERTRFSGEFYQALIAEVQDSYIKQAAEGDCAFEICENPEAMEKDYLDSSRIGGKRVKESDVSDWFATNLRDWMADKIATKYPKWEEEKVSALAGQYQKSFGELAKISLPQSKETSARLSKVWNDFKSELPEGLENDPMVEYVGNRLEKLSKRHADAEEFADAV